MRDRIEDLFLRELRVGVGGGFFDDFVILIENNNWLHQL